MKAGAPKKTHGGEGGSVGKAVAVLQAFVDGQSAWGVRELANALDQPGSSIHRLLQILRQHGLVEWDAADQKYRAGMELFRWAAIVNRRFKLADAARPIMSELSAAFDESCWLGVYDQQRAAHVYVAEVQSGRPFNYSAPLGKYEPLEKTAGGAAILAHLPKKENTTSRERSEPSKTGEIIASNSISVEMWRIRLNGYASREAEELDTPITVAAPVFSARNIPIGSLTLAIPRHRCSGEQIRGYGLAVVNAANRLSRLIGSQVVGAAGAGTWHRGVYATAALIKRELPAIGPVIASRGGDGALSQLQAGQGGYCFAVADSLSAAYVGKPPFNRPHDRLRAMFGLPPILLHIAVRRDSKIQTFADLRHARISAGDRDFSTASTVIELLQLSGLAKNVAAAERRLVFLDYPEAHREFVEGKLDVVIALTGMGDPSYEDLCRRSDTRLLPIDRKLVDDFIKKHPTYERSRIPARVYRGNERAIPTIMVPTVMVTTIDRNDDEVHNVTRAIFEHKQELSDVLPGFGHFDPRSVFGGIEIPLHPAAERFWSDIGFLEQRKAKHR